jgi:predicted nucleotidyltransferase
MLKVCNVDLEHREEIYKKIKQFAHKLRHQFSIQKVYLFGSWAKKEVHEGSDIDMIVVGDFKGKKPERIGEVLQFTDLPVEPLVYTPVEFERLKKTSVFLKEVLKTAKQL